MALVFTSWEGLCGFPQKHLSGLLRKLNRMTNLMTRQLPSQLELSTTMFGKPSIMGSLCVNGQPPQESRQLEIVLGGCAVIDQCQRSSIKLLNAPDMWCLSVRTFEASTSTDRGYSPHNIHIQSFASIQFDRTTIIILLSIICAPLIEGIRCELLFCENWKWFGSTQLTRTKAFLIWGVISLSLCLALCGTSIMTLPEIKIENPTLENDSSISLPPKYWLMMAWQL